MAQHILLLVVRVYRLVISPAKTFLVGPLGQCRFTPSCSEYALVAIKRHGALAGSWLAVKRICRCHPWGGCGDDPVPPSRRRHEHGDPPLGGSIEAAARFPGLVPNASGAAPRSSVRSRGN